MSSLSAFVGPKKQAGELLTDYVTEHELSFAE